KIGELGTVSIYTLLLIIKKQMGLKVSMHTMLTVVSVNIFEKVPLHELFTEFECTEEENATPNQLLINY
ncbi:MAG: hypothetical protein WC378_16195, partial [Opitutaceae bacterium]